LKDEGKRLPDGLILMSPSTDLTMSSASWTENKASDIMIGKMGAFDAHELSVEEKFTASLYLQGQDGRQPYVSPLFGDLAGLPPTICVASEVEVLRDDSIRLHEKAIAAGVDFEFHLWPYVYHDWAVAGEPIPEARETIESFKVFMDRIEKNL
jgi:acetyl esterase/lipase